MLGSGGGSGDGDVLMGSSSGDEKGGPSSGGGGGGGGGEVYEGDRSTGGNRWPRQETIALLQIRSDMDAAFRDSSLKGPLWEEVSRKMADLGYHRSGKKCKEKFENVYKYHKRTKEGRVAKADGKTYRFFDQLEAFDQQQHHHHHLNQQVHHPHNQHSNYISLGQPPSSQVAPDEEAVPVTMVMPASAIHHHVTVTSSGPNSTTPVHPPINVIHQHLTSGNPLGHVPQPQLPAAMQTAMREPMPTLLRSASATPSSSSLSTSSDEEVVTGTRKRKRKWRDYFERMAKRVISKQEELQRRFMEAVEKQEQERVAREEVWKMQEMARLKREHETIMQERSMAAAKDAALISFLQKIAEQKNIPLPLNLQIQAQVQTQHPQPPPPPQPQLQPQVTPVQIQKTPPPPQPPPLTPPPQHHHHQQQQSIVTSVLPQQQQTPLLARPKTNGDNHQDLFPASQGTSSRWPKAEVQALINLRASMDSKYQENGPKGPLWEEISSAMKKLGYNRNAKRCKEKWENINKYFKKVKESNKKRREDSKTCPYFDQLDALYKEKNKLDPNTTATNTATTTTTTAMITTNTASTLVAAYPAAAEVGQVAQPDSEENEESDEEYDEEDEEEEGSGGGYEIVANNVVHTTGVTATTTGSITMSSGTPTSAAPVSTTTATTTATAE